MASKYKDKDGSLVMSFNGVWVSWSHTIFAYGMCADRDPALSPVRTRRRNKPAFAPLWWG